MEFLGGFGLYAAALLLGSSVNAEREVVKATACEIIENPASFERRKVVISGFYKPHYETIRDRRCPQQFLPIKLGDTERIGQIEFAKAILQISEPDAPLFAEDAVVAADFIGVIVPNDNGFDYPNLRRISISEFREIRIENIPEAALIPTRTTTLKEGWNF